MRAGLTNPTSAVAVFLVLLPGCDVGGDPEVVETETTAVDAFDTEEGDGRSGEDEAPSSPPPNDDTNDDTNDDAADGTEGSGPEPVDPDARIVEFRIQPGTGNDAWNTEADMLVTYVGQTLLLINDDTIPHTLHSFGVPMPHGDPIEPGESARYSLDAPYDRGDEPPELWDHEAGEPAYLWLQVLPRDPE